MNNEDEIVKSIKCRMRLYGCLQLSWFVVHYVCGIAAVIAGALASLSTSPEVSPFIQENTWLWGLLATVLAGIITFLAPLQKAKNYKKSYYQLFMAVQKYEVNLIDIGDLILALDKAQERVLKLSAE